MVASEKKTDACVLAETQQALVRRTQNQMSAAAVVIDISLEIEPPTVEWLLAEIAWRLRSDAASYEDRRERLLELCRRLL